MLFRPVRLLMRPLMQPHRMPFRPMQLLMLLLPVLLTGIWLVIFPPSMLLIRPLQLLMQPLPMLSRPVQLSMLMLPLPVLLTEIWLLILVSLSYFPEDAKMILTRDKEEVDLWLKQPPTPPLLPKAMVVDDGKDIEQWKPRVSQPVKLKVRSVTGKKMVILGCPTHASCNYISRVLLFYGRSFLTL